LVQTNLDDFPGPIPILPTGGIVAAATLRDALANAVTGDTVGFALLNPINTTIQVLGPLPTISQSITVNGLDLSGAKIELTPGLLSLATDALTVNAPGGATIENFAIDRFSGSGIVLNSSNNVIQSNTIFANGIDGILIVGGTANTVAGNSIGVDMSGVASGNSVGVEIDGPSSANSIGSGNIIAGNLNDGVLINGASANTVSGNFIGTNATGTTGLANGLNGIDINGGAAGNSVGGNVISGNSEDGVLLSGLGTNSNTVAGNSIGITSGGSALGNSLNGVEINASAANNVIGSGNVISGNLQDGVLISGANANSVAGNFIGTNAAGSAAIANGFNGVEIAAGATGNLIGSGNVIAGNSKDGVLIDAANANSVGSNLIGTNASGTALGNTVNGVEINSGSSNEVQNNTIRFNAKGVVVVGSTAVGNSILGNRIFSNTSLGIDLGNDGVTLNDLNDTDTGPNRLQNFPDLSVAGSGGNLLITGNLNSDGADGTVYRIDFFANATADPSGNGQGEVFLGSQNVTITGLTAPISFPHSPVPGKPFITATATNLTTGDTSEFSADVALPTVGVTISSSTVAEGSSVTLTFRRDETTSALAVKVVMPATNTALFGTDYTLTGPISGASSSGFTVNFAAGAATETVTLAAISDGLGADALESAVFNLLPDPSYAINPLQSSVSANIPASGTVVTNTNDAGEGSLRQAILNADAGLGSLITFAIPGPGVHTIIPTSALPAITVSSLTVDGWSQGGGAYQGPPLVEVDGASAGSSSGLVIDNVPNVTIRGLAINQFKQDGIDITGTGALDNLIEDNFIGTDPTGANARGNSANGVAISGGASHNTVGGLLSSTVLAGGGNLISANGANGVFITGADTTANVVEGNFIGTALNGSSALGNSANGVLVEDSSGNLVGGSVTGGGNVIAANGDGVLIWSTGGVRADKNAVLGNYIGTAVDGLTAQGNTLNGVEIRSDAVAGDGASGNSIGGAVPPGPLGTMAFTGNLISANLKDGVLFDGTGVTANSVAHNFIGTDVTGIGGSTLGNHGNGVELSAAGNTLGGVSSNTIGAGNVISLNTLDGVHISNSGALTNLVVGNFIGTDKTGTLPRGNQGSGVAILNGALANNVGGTAAGAGNIIAANAADGVLLASGAAGNLVEGNFVGTNSGGTPLGNAVFGVAIVDASDNTVGGATLPSAAGAAGNVIAANGNDGVHIEGQTNAGASGNVVAGNLVGVDLAGAALANAGNGVAVVDASLNTVGGVAGFFAGNLISANQQDGVLITNTARGAPADGNLVQSNYIGTTLNGTAALPNQLNGVEISAASTNGATGNIIGAFAAPSSSLGVGSTGNVISGNLQDGVLLDGIGVTGNFVRHNFVGTTNTGVAALPNQSNGIEISTGASANSIGSGNVVSGNVQDGIRITGSGTNRNRVFGNLVGTDATGLAALGNTLQGVSVTNGANQNTVGGGNVISANGQDGVFLNNVSGTVVASNLIGTTSKGATALGNSINGVEINAATGSSVTGNVLSGNKQDGVLITAGASGNRLAGNFIGTDITGSVGLANANNGVDILGSSNNTVGGTSPPSRILNGTGNLISGNQKDGVFLNAASGNFLFGNYIGTNLNGNAALGNASNGVELAGSNGNTIGGGNALGNVVSGNSLDGVLLSAGSNGNDIEGNLIGTDGSGSFAVPNALNGVDIFNSSNNSIGKDPSAGGFGNVVSGNSADGVLLNSATGNSVSGNSIGTNRGGGSPLGNSVNGVEVRGGSGNEIGSSNAVTAGPAGGGNVISANGTNGVFLTSGTTTNTLSNNFIGTDDAGAGTLGNANDGILIDVGVSGNTIGGAGPRNIIANNGNAGVEIIDAAGVPGNLVQNNLIGTDVTGTTALGNNIGVLVDGTGVTLNQTTLVGNTINLIAANNVAVELAGTANGTTVQGLRIGDDMAGNPLAAALRNGVGLEVLSSNNFIGGPNLSAANAFFNNSFEGVVLTGAGSRNLLQANFIGTVDGTNGPGNGGDGLQISDLGDNTVQGNFIGRNGGDGMNIIGANGNLVTGNFIGTDVTGKLPAANAGNGIEIGDAAGNTIGGQSSLAGSGLTGAGNVVAANGGDGIYLHATIGSGAEPNLVQGNFIGTDVTGLAGLGNTGNGVRLQNETLNTIGGALAGQGNLISANKQDGVFIDDTGGLNNENLIEGNYIGTNVQGTSALGNSVNGVEIGSFAANLAFGNTIGGATSPPAQLLVSSGAGNLISGNTQNGILLFGAGVQNTMIQGNLIGTDRTGSLGLGNGLGVQIHGALNNQVLGNLVSASHGYIQSLGLLGTLVTPGDGVLMTSGASGNLLTGNFIGTDSTGLNGLGNSANGVEVTFHSANNTIGGLLPSAGNLIAFNGSTGVVIGFAPTSFLVFDSGTVGNAILGNAITSNGVLGIDLNNDGVTPNDFWGHIGPNDFQNFPILQDNVTNNGDSATVQGSLHSTPNTMFRIELFSNLKAPGNIRQGQFFLTAFNVQTDSNGDVTFVQSFKPPKTAQTTFLTATATALNALGQPIETSEFSNLVALPPPPVLTSHPLPPLPPELTPRNSVSSIDAVLLPPVEPPNLVASFVSADPLVDAPGEIVGRVLEDPDGAGPDGANLYPMEGQVIFLDTNNNGVLDPGERYAITNDKGEFMFLGLRAGRYVVRPLLLRNQFQTFSTREDNLVELRSGAMNAINVNIGVKQPKARRRPSLLTTALPAELPERTVILEVVSESPAASLPGPDQMPLFAEDVPASAATEQIDATTGLVDTALDRGPYVLAAAALVGAWQYLEVVEQQNASASDEHSSPRKKID
jgi:parallel beta-helix repeat protein